MNKERIARARVHIARIGKLLYERHLTDSGGGNISVRVDDLIVISPRYSGSKRQWDLSPEDVLVCDIDRNILEGSGEVSREANVHFNLHREFRDHGTAVIHAHAKNIMVIAALNQSMPPVLEANLKFGDVPVIDYAPAHSPVLGQNVVNAIRGNEAKIRKHAAGVIAPWHGVFLMAKDLDAALDAVERFDTNAYCILTARAAGLGDRLEQQRVALAEAALAFGKE